MAVFVQKVWNDVPCVVTEGVAIEFSKSGTTLYVLNADGHRMSMFKAGWVTKYWVEGSPAVLLPEMRGEFSQTAPS
jgi:hypothetical protein